MSITPDTKQDSIRFTLFNGLGRTLFVSLLLFSLLPLSVAGLLSYKKGYDSLREKEVKSLQAAVNLRNFYLTFYFEERFNDLILHADFSENIVLLQRLEAAFTKSGLPLEQFIKTYKYISIVTEHGGDIQEFQELAGDYHDILLIDPQGNILHSVAGEANLGTNIFTGPYQGTELAKVSRRTMDLGQTLCSDLSIHESSGNRESLFATQIMVDEGGDIIGIMVMQVTMGHINSIMTDASGLGESGQVFLVGNDGSLRSSLRLGKDTAILGKRVESPLVSQWLAREKIRHGQYPDDIINALPVLSEAMSYHGENHTPTLALSHDVDKLGPYDIHWLMIAEINESEAFAASKDLGEMILLTLLVTVVLVSLLAMYITRRMILPLSTITVWSRNVAQGDLTVQPIKTQDNEIGTLYQAMTEMVSSLKNMMSHKDQQDWLKSGESGLNTAMQGEQDLATLGQNILNYICDYLQLQVGAFFLLENDTLRLKAGYAYNINQAPVPEFTLGEGLVGQAALEKKAILFNGVARDHLHLEISSALGTSLPQNILVLPLLQEDVLMGVLELGSSCDFSDQEIQFLDKVSPVVAINVKTTLAGQKVQTLLEETQHQSEQLKKRQEELKSSNEELQEKTDFLEKQRQEITAAKKDVENKAQDLEQASKYKSEFLANMSHELRSPLNSLLILAQSLADNDEGNLTAEQVKEAQIIHSGGLDLLHLINDILDLSKVEAGEMEVHLDEIKFSSLVEDMDNHFQPLAKDKNLIFNVELDPQLPPAMVTDKQRLKQILTNLLSNSIKFTNQGSIRLTIKPTPAQTRFRDPELMTAETISFIVADTGIGIPEDKQRGIFEAFQQADGSTSRNYGGTGLGLTISRQFTKMMGGEIRLESCQGEGTTFTLYLPSEGQALSVTKPQVESTVVTNQHPPKVSLMSPGVGQPALVSFLSDDRTETKSGDNSLLIIEDDKGFAGILLRMARKRGFKVLTASNGRNGISQATEYLPKAIILDLGLPDIDGSVVLDDLRQNPATKHIPVHVVSARDKSADIMNKGVVGYLTKPLQKAELTQLFGQIEEEVGTDLKKLLIVEGNTASQSAIIKLVDQQKIKITTVSNGNEALRALDKESPDCIIMGLDLPDINSFEVLDGIKKKIEIKRPPVVIYCDREITVEERSRLQLYIDSVVIKNTDSTARLLEEVSGFLHSIAPSSDEQQKYTLPSEDNEEVFLNKKILVVDDDMRNTFALAGMLKKSGIKVELAGGGEQALAKLADHNDIALILMDIMMPEMDGYECTRRIRSQEHFKELPIIALTAKAMPEDRQRCLDAGASDYLAKPVDKEKLFALMREWLLK